MLSNIRNAAILASAFAAFAAAPASAAITNISSSATGLYANLSIGSLVGLEVGPLATASGSAPPAYSDSDTVLGVDQSLNLGMLFSQSLSTGVINAAAQSNGFSGHGTAQVDGLGVGLDLQIPFLPSVTLLGLDAGVIQSSTIFDGTGLNGSSSIADLTLNALILSVPIDLDGVVNAAPNTVLLNLLGLKITLNEQIFASNVAGNVTTNSLTTNALHIAYSDFLVGGRLLNGDIIVAQSIASYSETPAVPEPATWALLISGFGIVGMAARRRRPAIAAC